MRARATEFRFLFFVRVTHVDKQRQPYREGRALYPVSDAGFYIPCAMSGFISHERYRLLYLVGAAEQENRGVICHPGKYGKNGQKNTIFWQIRLFGVIPRQKAFCSASCTKRMLARVRFFGTIWYLQSLFSVLQLWCKENSQHIMQREKGEK